MPASTFLIMVIYSFLTGVFVGYCLWNAIYHKKKLKKLVGKVDE